MSKSIPDRWLEYKPFGEVIKGTKILAFKVPLKEGLNNNLKPEQRFTTAILLEAFPQLKCIVDLTNTYRYYDKQEVTNAGVVYQKLMLPGREIPSMDLVKHFFKVMDKFMSTSGEDEIIGVHCTHGINRTGYLICRYLVQQLGWEVEDSLKAFGEARGYSIERDIYINALKETPRGEKIDTSDVKLLASPPRMGPMPKKKPRLSHKRAGVRPYPMGPPGFAPPRRPFANNGAFPPQHFGFGNPPPGFCPPMQPPPRMPPMQPPPRMPPIPPPPPPGRPMYGPRPFKYGLPPMRPPVMPPPPPGPGFPMPGFPLRMPGPPPPLRPVGAPRLPPGPPPRLPLPKMPPPPPPSVITPRAIGLKGLHNPKSKQRMRNGIMPARNPLGLNRRDSAISRIPPKTLKEQDFTVDTFEENLLTVSTRQQRRSTKRRYNNKSGK